MNDTTNRRAADSLAADARGSSRPRMPSGRAHAGTPTSGPHERNPPPSAFIRGLVFSLLATLALAGAAAAQTVRWEAPAALVAGERATLDLVFDGTEPEGGIALPRIEGLTLLGSPDHQTSMTSVNGKVSNSVTLRYPVRAERTGRITIPLFGVETSGGTAIVAGLALDVARADAAGRGGDEAVIARLTPATRAPYAGEVFDVDLTISLAAGRRGEIVGAPAWQNGALVTEPWSEGRQVDAGGRPAVRMRARALAPEPGEQQVPPARQEMRLDTGRRGANPFGRLGGDMMADMDRLFGDSFVDSVFARANLTDATVESNGAALEVRPLPQPAADGFTGAVGQFALESKIVPESPRTGEPVTWTLTLRGTGNWPVGVALPPRAVPASMRTLQPKQQRHFEPGDLFSGAVSEDIVLIPSQPGTLRLEPVRFTYFDPRTERYETTVVEPPPLNVGGEAIAASTGAGTAPGSSKPAGEAPQANPSSGSSSSTSLASATSPDAPPRPADARLPREPQAGVGVALGPMPAGAWHRLLATPFVLLALFWLSLSLRRAWSTDPQRRRREALRQLRAAIEQAARAGEPEIRRRALLAWQHAAATVLEIDAAAPTPAHLRAATRSASPVPFSEWADLWADSDRVLYARDEALDPAWYDRSRRLCRTLRRPRRNPLRAFLPGNLLPRIATAALVLAATSAAHAGGLEDYAEGDFAAAREAWKQEATADPADWVARYNLGLAEAQLGDSGRALGETAAAFVHQPANEDVRWNLAAFAARIPGTDRTLARFAAEDGGAALARLASPAVWQLLALAGACLMSIGLGMGLWMLHSSARHHAAAAAVVLAGALLAGTSWACLRQYGLLADPGAALVARSAALRSVPTDAESSAEQRPLEAGAVVVVDKHFLGWSRISLAGGESGWLRSEALVPLYRGTTAEPRPSGSGEPRAATQPTAS